MIPTVERCKEVADNMRGVISLAPDASWCARSMGEYMLSINKSSDGRMGLYIASYEQAPTHELCDRMATAFGAPSVDWERTTMTTWAGRLHTAVCHWNEKERTHATSKED